MTLQEHLDEHHIKAKDFAKRIGVSKSYLSEILAHKKAPSLTVAAEIERETGGAVKAVDMRLGTVIPNDTASIEAAGAA